MICPITSPVAIHEAIHLGFLATTLILKAQHTNWPTGL